MSSRDWATQQLAEFLAAVSSFTDEISATRGALERIAEAFEAEVGALVRGEFIASSVGFGVVDVPLEGLLACAQGKRDSIEVAGIGECWTLAAPLEDDSGSVIVVGRVDEEFSREEEVLLRSMGRILVLTNKMVRTIENERSLREQSEGHKREIETLLASLVERQQLLERLSRIQSSISHRKPLQEVLDAIAQGAAELLNCEVVGLRLIDPDDPDYMITLSTAGVSEEQLQDIKRIPVGAGAGGRAVSEDRLIVIEHYDQDPQAIGVFKDGHLQTAMAAPVHEHAAPIGSLVVASYRPGRRFSEEEKSVLISFADHASLALSDAKTVEEMREAQRSKDMFLAMVSHELKTPLTVIMGTLRTLERFGDTLGRDDRDGMLKAAYERGNELRKLIDRLLEGASAELADADVEASLGELISDAVKGFEHSFRLRVADIPDVTLAVNGASVQRVIGILIENALAHSPSTSSIVVGASASSDIASFWVENEGSLPDGDPEQLFTPFHRGSEAKSSGVGLGLYIAKRIAEAMDGVLTASSDDGLVRFTLRVPTKTNFIVRHTSPVELARKE